MPHERFERSTGYIEGTQAAEAVKQATSAFKSALGLLEGGVTALPRQTIKGLQDALDVLDKYSGPDDDD
jgi:hypothetical protein